MSNNPGLEVLFPVTNTTTAALPNPNETSIMHPSGTFGSFATAMQSGAVPTFMSSAGWSDEAKGFPQQTFLGASIRSFNMQGGFGDSSSSLTVDLIVDEYNPSDRTMIGKGDDVYHSGIIQVPDVNGLQKSIGDNFVPPIPGSPVFFKFGPNFATVEEAYRKTFDDLYRIKTIGDLPDIRSVGPNMDSVLGGSINLVPNQYVDLEEQGATIKFSNQPRGQKNYNSIRSNVLTRGVEHIVFGGILQTYTQSRSPAGNPLYTVNVIDPREILSNVA
jgi:hypothetical protein